MNKPTLICLLFVSIVSFGQNRYWDNHTQLTPWRMPLVENKSKIVFEDLDGDGDPDILKTFVFDSIPVIWIDDDDDMTINDLEGDQDNDCLLIDRNKDGIFAGPKDLSIDWTDTNEDGIADIQLVVSCGSEKNRNFFDWNADFMYIIDFGEKDGIQNFINWNDLAFRPWEHSGHSNFYTDYHGNTLFLKMGASSFRINDTRYSWENPFIFYDKDKDGLTEIAVRLVDTPIFRPKIGMPEDHRFENVDKNHDVIYSKKIDWVSMAWDLDNDNGQGNEFDFDMSLRFTGNGFNYDDQIHKFKNLKGLQAANKYFYDSSWRKVDELIYTDPVNVKDKVFNKGEWKDCWIVFDEDDDCNRWERVEFYEPLDLWKIGQRKGGLDNNSQADAIGDRGEFDTDFSGKGNLYLSVLDGRIHLFGAEWGAWRIDMNASCFQGYGGLYYPAKTFNRLPQDPSKWATVRYSDTNGNGFFDLIEYDLDGNTVFEEKVSLLALGIDDKSNVINTADLSYNSMKNIFKKSTEEIWKRAEMAKKIAKKLGVSSSWYAFWQHPRTLSEKYQYGYWLNFYLYKDMCHQAEFDGNMVLRSLLDKAYYSGNWNLLMK